MNPWFWHCSRLQGFGSTAGSAAFLLWNDQENTCVYFSQIHNFKGKEAPYFLNLAYISPVKHCFEKENSDHGKGWSVWWWISFSIKTNELNSLLAGKNCRCIPEKQYREYHKNPHRNSRRESWVNAAGGWHPLGDKLTEKRETRQYHNTKKSLFQNRGRRQNAGETNQFAPQLLHFYEEHGKKSLKGKLKRTSWTHRNKK